MNNLEDIKYKIGDVVYWATTIVEQKRHDCPDCLGKKEWEVTSPAGTDYTFVCPRCGSGYRSSSYSSLSYSEYGPAVNALTIGAVHFRSEDDDIQYMCIETGVGGGSVYNQEDLYLDKETALIAAKVKAINANENSKDNFHAAQMKRAADISDYQLDNAVLKEAQEIKASVYYHIHDFINELEVELLTPETRTILEEWQEKVADNPISKQKERITILESLCGQAHDALRAATRNFEALADGEEPHRGRTRLVYNTRDLFTKFVKENHETT